MPNFFAKKEVAAPTNTNVIGYKLEDMTNRVADHSSPDALVYIAPGYDKTKPIHLVVYNHGMMTNLNEVEEKWELSKAMKNAAPNTVLLAPEWAVNPASLSDNAGKFHQPNFFRKLVAEAFSKVPELEGRSLDNVNEIHLSSYSGGIYPLVSELDRNGINAKIKSIALYDSLYKGQALDHWLKANIQQLHKGEKQYSNFYFHTYPQSLQQMNRVKKMLADAKLGTGSMRADTSDPHTVLEPERIAIRGITYKYTMAGIDETYTGHMAAPKVYIPLVLQAMKLREEGFTPTIAAAQARVTKKKEGIRRFM